MTWKYISLPLLVLGLFACRNTQRSEGYELHPKGYYFRLLAFDAGSTVHRQGDVAWLSAVFSTQNDSVFWDSANDLGNRFFMRLDSAASDAFAYHVAHCAPGDSVSLLLPAAPFFATQFHSQVLPFFSANDSVVKVNFRLLQVFGPSAFLQKGEDLRLEEERRLAACFSSAEARAAALDPAGFYWLSKPDPSNAKGINEGDVVILQYEGQYLNGRLLEQSGQRFELIYGTPDQLLKGLNSVIGQLKLGQTAKILLPSRLAFGESGSSNGIVPPYTPLVYTVKICDVKTKQ